MIEPVSCAASSRGHPRAFEQRRASAARRGPGPAGCRRCRSSSMILRALTLPTPGSDSSSDTTLSLPTLASSDVERLGEGQRAHLQPGLDLGPGSTGLGGLRQCSGSLLGSQLRRCCHGGHATPRRSRSMPATCPGSCAHVDAARRWITRPAPRVGERRRADLHAPTPRRAAARPRPSRCARRRRRRSAGRAGRRGRRGRRARRPGGSPGPDSPPPPAPSAGRQRVAGRRPARAAC